MLPPRQSGQHDRRFGWYEDGVGGYVTTYLV